MTDEKQLKIDVVMEEYRNISQEMFSTLDRNRQIIYFIFSLIILGLGLVFEDRLKIDFEDLVNLYFILTFIGSGLILSYLYGVTSYILLADYKHKILEPKLNEIAGSDRSSLIGWEDYIRQNRDILNMAVMLFTTLFIIYLPAFLSYGLGIDGFLYVGYQNSQTITKVNMVFSSLGMILAFLFSVLFLIQIIRKSLIKFTTKKPK